MRVCEPGGAIFLFKVKQVPSSYRLVKEFPFLKRAQNQFMMLLEMCIVLANIDSTERNANLLKVYVATPRSNFVCGKCGAWLSVHKILFTLQELVKRRKTDNVRLFLAKKDELGTPQTFVQ